MGAQPQAQAAARNAEPVGLRRRCTVTPAFVAAAALLLLGAPRLLAAQGESAEVRVGSFFLERSYFSPASPLGQGYVFDGEAAQHLTLHQGTDRGWLATGDGVRSVVSLSFLPVARMTTDSSVPVRTPSFRIRPLLVQHLWLRAPSRDDLTYRVTGFSWGLTHYSNGQDGCFFLGSTRDADGACVVSDLALYAREEVNERDGSFSTTYVPLRVDLQWGAVDRLTESVRHSNTVGAELQLDTWDSFTGGMDRVLARTYGRHQLALWWERERATGAGYLRYGAKGMYRFRSAGGDDWASGSVELSHIWRDWNHAGLFARLRLGGDDYNIRFRRQGPFVHLGVVFDPGAVRSFPVQ